MSGIDSYPWVSVIVYTIARARVDIRNLFNFSPIP